MTLKDILTKQVLPEKATLPILTTIAFAYIGTISPMGFIARENSDNLYFAIQEMHQYPSRDSTINAIEASNEIKKQYHQLPYIAFAGALLTGLIISSTRRKEDDLSLDAQLVQTYS